MKASPDQDDLFTTRARTGDPDTSFEAAHDTEARLRFLQQQVLAFFRQVRRATNLDVELHFGDHGATYRTRVSELVEMGWLRDSGERIKQVSPRKRRATRRVVWELTEKEAL